MEQYAQEIISYLSEDGTWRIGKRNLFCFDELDIYVRVGCHSIDGEIVKCVDIASINVHIPGHKYGRSLIEAIWRLNPLCTYVEIVSNRKLRDYLEQSGWTLIAVCQDFNYYKMPVFDT